MSNAEPGLLRQDTPPGETRHLVVYAQDMSPADEDWWQAARDAVGGDDFVYFIDAAEFENLIEEGREYADLVVDGEWLRIGYEGADFDLGINLDEEE